MGEGGERTLLQLLSSCLHRPVAHLLLWEGQRHAKKRGAMIKNQNNFRIFEKITWHPPPPPILLSYSTCSLLLHLQKINVGQLYHHVPTNQ